ncbi:MAG: methyltransferase [Flavobacteriaceae bacterium]
MKVFQQQLWHFLILIALLAAVCYCVEMDDTLLRGELWGISTGTWLVISLLAPILHQIYVLIFWRLELHYKTVTLNLGTHAFRLFKLGFAILILARPVSIICLAVSNAWTLDINPVVSYIVSGILFLPAVYLFYSIRRYFGIDRAFGIDHFEPEKYRNEIMIREGIFKYSGNAMYVYGFLALWIPGILLQSKAALLLALFNHLYIWVHFYFTELPDMKIIYGKEND